MSEFIFTKQPAEEWTLSVDFAARIPEGALIDTAVVYASRKVTTPLTTSLSGSSAVNATTVDLVANPGVGAHVTINPGTLTTEIVKVSAIAGVGPYTATIAPPLGHIHSNAEPVEYEPGVSGIFLVSADATIEGTTTVFTIRRGVSGQVYRVSIIAVLDMADVREADIDVTVADT